MSTKATPRPTQVRIFGRTYSITYVPQSDLSNTNLGLTDHATHRIYAEDNQPPVEEVDTVLHEVFHAIRATMRVHIDPESEETMVLALATGLVGVLQDNPEFAKWLVQERPA